MTQSPAERPWQDRLYETLRSNHIDLFVYVPDGGHKILINRSLEDASATSIPLTNEAEGVPMLAGYHLGGKRGALLMQSSGVGNCVNQFSLVQTGNFPFLTIVTMRGDFGEQNAWQIPMGQGVRPVMEAMGITCIEADRPDEIEVCASAAVNMAYRSRQGVGLLLTQKLIGAKAF